MNDSLITPTPAQPEAQQSPFQTPAEQTPPSFPEAPSVPSQNQNPKPKRSKKPLFLSLLVIILIGGASYGVYAWQHKKVSNQNSQISNLQGQVSDLQRSVNAANSSSETKKDPSSFIKLSELGIQFPKPTSTDLKDLTYRITHSSAPGSYPTAFFSTDSLDGLEPEGGGLLHNALGSLIKTAGQYPKSPTDQNSTGTLVKQFSNFYIATKNPATDPFEKAVNNQKAAAIRTELEKSFALIEELE